MRSIKSRSGHHIILEVCKRKGDHKTTVSKHGGLDLFSIVPKIGILRVCIFSSEMQRLLPISFYEVGISLIWHPVKDIAGKENQRPIFFMSTDAKILNNTLTN